MSGTPAQRCNPSAQFHTPPAAVSPAWGGGLSRPRRPARSGSPPRCPNPPATARRPGWGPCAPECRFSPSGAAAAPRGAKAPQCRAPAPRPRDEWPLPAAWGWWGPPGFPAARTQCCARLWPCAAPARRCARARPPCPHSRLCACPCCSARPHTRRAPCAACPATRPAFCSF